MKALFQLLAVPVLALASLAGPAAPVAKAQDRGYAMTTIENPTGLTIRYSVQWGDGRWTNYTLSPGEYRIHYREYGPEGRFSPPLRVRFDCTLCDDEFIAEEYVLERHAGFDIDRYASKRYVFRRTGCLLDLYAVN